MESANKIRIPLKVADSATAQFNNTNVLLSVCGFHKLFWNPQIHFAYFYDFAYFCSSFERCNFLGFVCGIQNSREDQRKVAMLEIPRES